MLPLRPRRKFLQLLVPVGLSLVALSCAGARSDHDGAAWRRTDDLHAQLDACRREHERQVSSSEIEALRAELRRYKAGAGDEVARRDAMLRAMDRYTQGVCLIHGAYILLERTADGASPVKDAEGNPFRLEYLGSGFLAGDEGRVITNRHVAEPWWNNETVAPLLSRGLEPRFELLTVTFPGHEPINVDPSTIRVSDLGVDLATFTVHVQGVPVLPLSDRDPSELRGQRLMLMGYPTGLSALIARADPDIVSEAIADARDTSSLIDELSKRRAIAPVITHGTLNDVTTRQLIYDAITTSGGSGGPVFGAEGEVIGVNFAVLRDFQGANFGVPIRFAQPLLH